MNIIFKGRRTDVQERFRKHASAKLGKIEKLDHKAIKVDVEVSQERNPRLSGQWERVELTIRSRGPVIRAEAAADDRYVALDRALAKLEQRLRRSGDRRKAARHGVSQAGRAPTARSMAAASAAEALATVPSSRPGETPGSGASEGSAGADLDSETSLGQGRGAEEDIAEETGETPGARRIRVRRGTRAIRGSRATRRSRAARGASASRGADASERSGGTLADVAPEPDLDSPEAEGIVPIQMEGDGPVVVREKFHTATPMSVDQALLAMELVGHDFYLFRDDQRGLPSVVYRRHGYQYGLIRLVDQSAADLSGQPDGKGMKDSTTGLTVGGLASPT